MGSSPAATELAIATVVAANHLARARVLAASLRRWHPDLSLVLLLMDEPAGRFDPAGEPFEVLRLADLPRTDDLLALAFRYGRRGASAAAKPRLVGHLLERGHPGVLFLDPDTVVTGDLTPVLDAVRGSALVLTPHLVSPARGDGARARELAIARSGILNAGVVGVHAGPVAEAFLEWWSERLLTHCVSDPAEGMHMDQRWLDLAPVLFGDVRLLRDPGVNVAYWNITERPVRIEGAQITVGGSPCRIVHASGYDAASPEILSQYAPAMRTAESGAAGLLADRYQRALLACGDAVARHWSWAFDRWADGVLIPPVAREAHRALGPAAARFGDPFAVGPGSFRTWLASSGTVI